MLRLAARTVTDSSQMAFTSRRTTQRQAQRLKSLEADIIDEPCRSTLLSHVGRHCWTWAPSSLHVLSVITLSSVVLSQSLLLLLLLLLEAIHQRNATVGKKTASVTSHAPVRTGDAVLPTHCIYSHFPLVEHANRSSSLSTHRTTTISINHTPKKISPCSGRQIGWIN